MPNFTILTTHASLNYELLDSGEGLKLERYGQFLFSRPDPQALWEKNLAEKEWQKADAIFGGNTKNTSWQIKKNVPNRWQIDFADLKFWIKPTTFKHVGLFPEQSSNWDWIRNLIKNSNRKISVINLFGYTGGATLAAAQAGAEVCHVDASKVAINWARENATLNDLDKKPIRWILDDARKFIQREIKRGIRYDAIIMDPPAFGHGAKGELWKIEDHFTSLFNLCIDVLSPTPLFFLINGYASGYSAIAYKNNLLKLQNKFGGNIEIGELTISESKSNRLLPCGIFSRWHHNG